MNPRAPTTGTVYNTSNSTKVLLELTAQEARLIEEVRGLEYGQIVINKEAGKIVKIEKRESIKI